MNNVLVTGGAGYIGSHAVLALLEEDYNPIILDNFVHGHKELVERLGAEVIVGDVGDVALVSNILIKRNITSVMHFAAYAYVGESVKSPAKYYLNNVAATASLLDSMVKTGVNKFVFSSSCATYGLPASLPICESAEQRPISPYGHSKRMVEQMLADFERAYGLQSVIFRYFNAAGADPGGRVGERHEPETHLIPLVLQAALGQRSGITVFGTDYLTPDGTCIRDYVHVSDLVSAHMHGLRHLEKDGASDTFNLGIGKGYSVLEIIEATKTVTGCDINVNYGPRRAGDPPILYAESKKVQSILGWEPKCTDIETMINDAWHWHKKDSSRW